jgi:hypothetical protein
MSRDKSTVGWPMADDSTGCLPNASKSSVHDESVPIPYSDARLSTLLTFAQSVYFMFSAVCVYKKNVGNLKIALQRAGR